MADDGLVVAIDERCGVDAPHAGDERVPVREDDDLVETVITTPRQAPTVEPYDLGWLYTGWAWESGYRDWDRAVRVLARTLRGLERT
jgi:hypothetical protein